MFVPLMFARLHNYSPLLTMLFSLTYFANDFFSSMSLILETLAKPTSLSRKLRATLT